MGYYTGTANDMAAVRAALTAACVSEGWAWNSTTEMLSKGALFLRLQIVSGYLTLLGRTSAAGGDMPSVMRIGQLSNTPITFPLIYEIFVFDGEVYMVLNYSVDYYQWCAFGQSRVQGLPGTGMWVGASVSATALGNQTIAISPTTGAFGSQVTPALFHATSPDKTYWVHSNLDDQGWWMAQSETGSPVGIKATVPLLGLLPNSWNSEAVLLPIRAYKIRPSTKISLTADLAYARQTRVDNYAPGEIITLGADRWKIFPWYRKNSGARDGGQGLSHTGTFGWAIRYEGP